MVKFPGFRKKKESGCSGCPSTPKPPFKLDEVMETQMKELEKNKVKSIPCPYMKICESKILSTDFEILCKDQEQNSMELKLVHMKGKHLWELCKDFYRNKTDKEGKKPREHLEN